MNEGLRNLAVLLYALCAINTNSYASDNKMIIAEEEVQSEPTIIYGASKKSENETDEVIVKQPEGVINPLGAPIVVPEKVEVQPDDSVAPALDSQVSKDRTNQEQPQQNQQNNNQINGAPQLGNGPQGVPVVPNTEAQLGGDFQNTVMEANGRVYDVQSFPVEDLNVAGNSSNPETIYSPNINN